METKLEFTFKNDTLFKLLFVQYPDLLKRLVSELLSIQYESIGEFIIRNPEIQPEMLGGKYCRLDINMTVNGQRVDLEIQVDDEGNFPERSLFYWAREYSGAIIKGDDYIQLPRTVVISILGYKQFDCEEFHSEFQALEVTRHTPLTDRLSLHYFELPKLPAVEDAEDGLKLWLALFNAKTEEDLTKIKNMGVPVMEQAIEAFHHVSASERLYELERMRDKARVDEAYALRHAAEKATKAADEKWQAEIERMRDKARVDEAYALRHAAEKATKAADEKWQSVVAEKDKEIARLREQLKIK